MEGVDAEPIHRKALQYLEAAGDAAAALYSNPEAFDHYEAAQKIDCPHDPGAVARVIEKQGDVAFRMGRVGTAVELWEKALEFHRQQEDLTRVADLHRKIGAGLWNRGERKQAIERYQKGINLLKDGPPCLELVHLYEEAASLYMHAGDNMLAIYASEKALRLAEKLQETRVASRAHGIFGRVFGRIGDTEKARENLERSVELARDSDDGETIRALLTLGHHLEVSEADYDGAGQAYGEALALAQQVGDLPAQVELQSSIAQVAAYRAAWDEVEVAAEASADLAEREGLVGKLCYPCVLRGVIAWREGRWEDAEQWCRRAHELAEQVGWSEVSFAALYWLARALRDSGDYTAAITELDHALDVCERAGLIAQSIEAMSARAITLVIAGKKEQGRETAEEAGPPGRPPALPGRQRRRPDGDGHDRVRSRGGHADDARGQGAVGGHRPPARRGHRGPAARARAGRGGPGGRARGARAAQRPTSSGSACRTSPSTRSPWSAEAEPALTSARLFACLSSARPDGAQLHWEERGEGPNVVIAEPVLLAARRCSTGSWTCSSSTIALVTYDMRGVGESSMQGPYDMETDAEDLAAVIEETCDGPVRDRRDGRRLEPRRADGARTARSSCRPWCASRRIP